VHLEEIGMHLKYNNEQITYKRVETIAKEGIRVTNIFYVMEGLVKVFIESPDKNIIIKLINSDDFIGLTSLFGDDTY
jgi:CRP-like cAMP-binding protein